jgi:hypothetical protein
LAANRSSPAVAMGTGRFPRRTPCGIPHGNGIFTIPAIAVRRAVPLV